MRNLVLYNLEDLYLHKDIDKINIHETNYQCKRK